MIGRVCRVLVSARNRDRIAAVEQSASAYARDSLMLDGFGGRRSRIPERNAKSSTVPSPSLFQCGAKRDESQRIATKSDAFAPHDAPQEPQFDRVEIPAARLESACLRARDALKPASSYRSERAGGAFSLSTLTEGARSSSSTARTSSQVGTTRQTGTYAIFAFANARVASALFLRGSA